MKNNFLKLRYIIKTTLFFCLFFCLGIFNIRAVDYKGIVVDESIIDSIKKRIDTQKLRSIYESDKFYVDYSNVYAMINSDNIYKMNFIVPIMNLSMTKVIGEISNSVSILENGNTTALSFIQGCDRSKVDVCFGKNMMTVFFRFGGVLYSKYIPSILKPKKTIIKKAPNTGYHYLPLKEKLD